MLQIVTSASGGNGDGYGALLAFDMDGALLGRFSDDDRISDPRGLFHDPHSGLLFVNSGQDRILAIDGSGVVMRDTGVIEGLDAGGGNFAPDGRYLLGLRKAKGIAAFDPELTRPGSRIVPDGIVPFPRGFAVDVRGILYLSSGIGPDGEGDDTIVAFDRNLARLPYWHVDDPELSPLDLILAPNGNVVVASEKPFGAPNAKTSLREYDRDTGALVRVFEAHDRARLRKPRGLRFGPGGNLHCAAQDEVVAFDFSTGTCLGATVRFDRLNGQALAFMPDPNRKIAERLWSRHAALPTGRNHFTTTEGS